MKMIARFMVVMVLLAVALPGVIFAQTPDFEWTYEFTKHDTSEWTVTKVGTASTSAILDSAFGVLKITGASGAADSGWNWQTNKKFVELRSGRPAEIEFRTIIDTTKQKDVFLGIAGTNTSIADSIKDAGTLNAVNFYMKDGDSSVYCIALKDTVHRTIDTTTIHMDDDSTKLGWHRWKISWNGMDGLSFFLDDYLIGRITTAASIPVNKQLAITFACLNGDATSRSMYLDYVRYEVMRR